MVLKTVNFNKKDNKEYCIYVLETQDICKHKYHLIREREKKKSEYPEAQIELPDFLLYEIGRAVE